MSASNAKNTAPRISQKNLVQATGTTKASRYLSFPIFHAASSRASCVEHWHIVGHFGTNVSKEGCTLAIACTCQRACLTTASSKFLWSVSWHFESRYNSGVQSFAQ
eukprot:2425931-Amphidinium_carterae.1